MSMIDIRNVKKVFGGTEVLKGIDLSVEKGDVVAILGPSGSGKTTFLRCINFLEKADEGIMTFDGQTYDLGHIRHRDIAAIRKKAAFVFQNYNLFANKTILENVMEALVTVKKYNKKDRDYILFRGEDKKIEMGRIIVIIYCTKELAKKRGIKVD